MTECSAVSPCSLARSEGDGCRAAAFEALDALLPEFRLIVNTVPAEVLPEQRLRLLRQDALVIDLASAPGGDGSGDRKAVCRK